MAAFGSNVQRPHGSQIEREFNEVQAAMSLRGVFRLRGAFYQLECPLEFRLVAGRESLVVENRPYASSKIRLDLWSGDPGDRAIIGVPVFGDLERTTAESFEPPPRLDESSFRVTENYDDVQVLFEKACPYPVRPQLGCALIMDAIVPYRRVRKGGSVRANVEN